jgi:hypothetical protein
MTLSTNGWTPSREVTGLLDLSNGLYEDAAAIHADEWRRARIAQDALRVAMWASESDGARQGAVRDRPAESHRSLLSWDAMRARSFHMNSDLFMERFTEIFDYATITYYLRTGTDGMPDFEPVRGQTELRHARCPLRAAPLRGHHRRGPADLLAVSVGESGLAPAALLRRGPEVRRGAHAKRRQATTATRCTRGRS